MPKILLAEDDEGSREMLSRVLSRRGYEVLVAVDGAAALQLGRTEAPDLILMDVGLPALDGWEATSRLRATPEGKNVPIIALTGYTTALDRAQALASGCDDCDAKPIEIERLVGKIEALLSRSKARTLPLTSG
jgi:two-component system cell cycle response regulator DivK